MMRTNTKKFKLIQFLANRNGTRYMDIERFICEMNGLNYDARIQHGFYAGKRRHSGIWATNLNSGKKPILTEYCFKADGLWFAKPAVLQFVSSVAQETTNIKPSTIKNTMNESNMMSTNLPNTSSEVTPGTYDGCKLFTLTLNNGTVRMNKPYYATPEEILSQTTTLNQIMANQQTDSDKIEQAIIRGQAVSQAKLASEADKLMVKRQLDATRVSEKPETKTPLTIKVLPLVADLEILRDQSVKLNKEIFDLIKRRTALAKDIMSCETSLRSMLGMSQ